MSAYHIDKKYVAVLSPAGLFAAAGLRFLL